MVIIEQLLYLSFTAPVAVAIILALKSISRKKPDEQLIASIAQIGFGIYLIATLILALQFAQHNGNQIRFGSLLVDWTGIILLMLIAFTANIIIYFSRRYLHRDPGYRRFFMILSIFAAGMTIIATAGNFVLLFAGWEFVGLSSFLLIAFYWHRPSAIESANRAFYVYRFCDVGLLASALISELIWHDHEMFTHQWSSVPLIEQWAISLVIMLPVIGKSAQFPFCYWLPKAMEGPTPSSAIFYGALSVHAGVFLLLRVYPIWHSTLGFPWIVGGIGLSTFVVCSLSGRVQSNIKGQIGYASIAQVGVMLIELALGFPKLAMAHMVFNAILRCFQLLYSPSVQADQLHIHHALEGKSIKTWNPRSTALYIFGLNEGYLETLILAVTSPVRYLSQKAYALRWWLPLVFFPLAYINPSWLLIPSFIWCLRTLSPNSRLQQNINWSLLSNLCVAFALWPSNQYFYISGLLVSWLFAFESLQVIKRQVSISFARFPFASSITLIGVLGILGFPISLTFLGEDMLIQAALSQGMLFLIAFNIIFVINGIALMRSYSRTFWGQRDDEATPGDDLSTFGVSWRISAYMLSMLTLSFIYPT